MAAQCWYWWCNFTVVTGTIQYAYLDTTSAAQCKTQCEAKLLTLASTTANIMVHTLTVHLLSTVLVNVEN